MRGPIKSELLVLLEEGRVFSQQIADIKICRFKFALEMDTPQRELRVVDFIAPVIQEALTVEEVATLKYEVVVLCEVV